MNIKPIIERQLIELKADVPRELSISGGVDVLRALFIFRYNLIHQHKSFYVRFHNGFGKSSSEKVHFWGDGFIQKQFEYEPIIGNDISTIFPFIEFTSKSDIIFELSVFYEEAIFL